MEKQEEERIKMRKAIALVLAIHGYRNSPIENIHAGYWPQTVNGKWADAKDVFVSVKGGTKIPWNKVSRISDEEMKHLNKTIHSQIYTLITLIEEGKLGKSSFFMNPGWGANWDEPELLDWLKDI